jgi:tRNA nucleotidyltransferase (CCA-adding enzyme)
MDLKEAIEARPDLKRVFEALTDVGEPYQGVYLVGGAVRDILLDRPGFDVDIAVEGDGIALAHALAEALGGRARAHPQFGTAVVAYGDGGRVDLATARTEHYEAPAVLPVVQHASMEEDLVRRDFTINAMAMSLKGEDFGRLVDPFGGRGDLASGTIRVLHDRSFVDDPTRIFRAVRYERRFGFAMDEHTEQLARESITTGHVRDLTPARVRDELQAVLDEGDGHAILRLGDLGLATAVHPRLAADVESARLFDRMRELKQQYAVESPRWRLGLEALARTVPADELPEWLAALKLRRHDARQVAHAVADSAGIVDELSDRDASPAEVVALAEPSAPDGPLFALALIDLEPLHAYFRRLRDVKLDIGGSDLAELGLSESPRVGEVLAELRRRKLNGELDGRESELAAARELIAELQ